MNGFNTNYVKVLDVWQGGSRRPGAILQSGNRDGDIAIHPTIKSLKPFGVWYNITFPALSALPPQPAPRTSSASPPTVRPWKATAAGRTLNTAILGSASRCLRHARATPAPTFKLSHLRTFHFLPLRLLVFSNLPFFISHSALATFYLPTLPSAPPHAVSVAQARLRLPLSCLPTFPR